MKPGTYRPPAMISRDDFLVEGSDAGFRRTLYALVQCVSRLFACREAFGRELGLTPSQFAVLMGVAHAQGERGVTIRELADHVALASTHVTTEVGRLQTLGFLTKRQNDADRRSVRVSLLPHARAEIARVAPFVRQVNDALFCGIDAGSLGTVHEVARQLILNSETALAQIRRRQLDHATPGPQVPREKPARVPSAARPRAGRPGAAERAPARSDRSARPKSASAEKRQN